MKKKKDTKIEFSYGEGKDAAKKARLHLIDSDIYTLVKQSAKNPSPYQYPDNYIVMKNSTISIVNVEPHAWIVATDVKGNWFKTSPVLITKKRGKDYILETENSFYKLERQ